MASSRARSSASRWRRAAPSSPPSSSSAVPSSPRAPPAARRRESPSPSRRRRRLPRRPTRRARIRREGLRLLLLDFSAAAAAAPSGRSRACISRWRSRHLSRISLSLSFFSACSSFCLSTLSRSAFCTASVEQYASPSSRSRASLCEGLTSWMLAPCSASSAARTASVACSSGTSQHVQRSTSGQFAAVTHSRSGTCWIKRSARGGSCRLRSASTSYRTPCSRRTHVSARRGDSPGRCSAAARSSA